MATKAQKDAAYKLIREIETDLIKDLAALADVVNAKLTELSEGVSPDSQGSAANQYLGRVQGAVMGVFGYDLQNLKAAYGLVDAADPLPQTA